MRRPWKKGKNPLYHFGMDLKRGDLERPDGQARGRAFTTFRLRGRKLWRTIRPFEAASRQMAIASSSNKASREEGS